MKTLKMLFGDKFGTLSQNHTTSSITFVDQAQAELVWYTAEPQLPLDHDPLLWWCGRTSSYPILGRLSRKHLCLPSTSVRSESLFSISGAGVNEKKAALDVDELYFFMIIWTQFTMIISA